MNKVVLIRSNNVYCGKHAHSYNSFRVPVDTLDRPFNFPIRDN